MRRLLPLIALLMLGLAPAPFPKGALPGVGAALVGQWEGPYRMVITPGRITFPERDTAYLLSTDPRKDPRAFDMRGIPATCTQSVSFVGIYKLEGDTLTLCFRPLGESRPVAFEGPRRTGAVLVFRRVKR
jgi:uncharacterized protein (TIGR03067 family)